MNDIKLNRLQMIRLNEDLHEWMWLSLSPQLKIHDLGRPHNSGIHIFNSFKDCTKLIIERRLQKEEDGYFLVSWLCNKKGYTNVNPLQLEGIYTTNKGIVISQGELVGNYKDRIDTSKSGSLVVLEETFHPYEIKHYVIVYSEEYFLVIDKSSKILMMLHKNCKPPVVIGYKPDVLIDDIFKGTKEYIIE